ncbi:MAG: hypothetical protein CMO01_00335 [Thalassobius sp.]|nr:hypothetical protein [Thalassovita sp.]
MASKEQVYEAFGELLYAVARSEGKVKQKTIEHLETLLQKYSWGEAATWSLKYEKEHKKTFDETYDRAIDIFVEYGPFEEYENFFNLIEEINEEEPSFIGSHGKKILINFKKKLHRAFMENEDITYDDNEIEEDE